jgi:hypothetical protein
MLVNGHLYGGRLQVDLTDSHGRLVVRPLSLIPAAYAEEPDHVNQWQDPSGTEADLLTGATQMRRKQPHDDHHNREQEAFAEVRDGSSLTHGLTVTTLGGSGANGGHLPRVPYGASHVPNDRFDGLSRIDDDVLAVPRLV